MANEIPKSTEDGFIEDGQQKVVMRHQMENKDLLKEKGSIYVGTGEKTAEGYPITKALELESDSYILKVKNGDLAWVDPSDDEDGINAKTSNTIIGDENDTPYKIRVVTQLPDSPAPNTIYYVKKEG